ncbi:MAG: aldo/keto reductase, partial [Actinopolymorphaceae bacterium]
MSTRVLGRSGIQVSALGLGCWAIGGPFTFDGRPASWGEVDDGQSIRALQAALDLGVTFFDTSDAYGTGRSEWVLGRAVAGRRDQVVIATKFGFADGRPANGADSRPERIRQVADEALRRLRTDHIDLYHLHSWDPDTPIDESLRALDDLVRQGKVRYIGCSNFLAYQLARSIGRSEVLGTARFDS